MPLATNPSDWQPGFLSMLPAVETHARIRFRRWPAQRREEAIAETIAAACLYYQQAIVSGRRENVRPGPLSDFAVRHAAEGRHVGGSLDRSTDALSPRAQRRHGFQATRISTLVEHGEWEQLAVASRRYPVPDAAAFRIDFPDWLSRQSRRDRRIIQAFLVRTSATEVARQFGLTDGRISQLRSGFAKSWRSFIGETDLHRRGHDERSQTPSPTSPVSTN